MTFTRTMGIKTFKVELSTVFQYIHMLSGSYDFSVTIFVISDLLEHCSMVLYF